VAYLALDAITEVAVLAPPQVVDQRGVSPTTSG